MMRKNKDDAPFYWTAYLTNRDPLSRDWLFEYYRYLVGNTRYRMAPEVRDPEDMEQEGCLALLYAIEHYDPSRGAQFITFAIRCIRSTYMKYLDGTLGKESRLPTVPIEDEIDEEHKGWMADDRRTPEEEILFEAARNHVRGCVQGLPELYREVIEPRFFLDMQLKDVARMLRRSAPTCLQRQEYGFRILRRYIPADIFGP
jgi:RNA polymerase sigma factor (sigma-70 family)